MRPASFTHRISAQASSTLFNKICATPARRPGTSLQKSTNQRLWARRPAHFRSYSSAVGTFMMRLPRAKKGGTVFGNRTSAAMPFDSRSVCRRPLSQLRLASRVTRSLNGISYAAAHASNSSCQRFSRYGL